MARAHAVQRQVQEEAIEIGIVGNAAAQYDRHIAIQTVRCPAFPNRNGGRYRESKVTHSLFAPFPGTPIPGLAQVGKQVTPHARRSVAREGTARRARSPLFATWKSSAVQTIKIKPAVPGYGRRA
jgi:hypothetical protein